MEERGFEVDAPIEQSANYMGVEGSEEPSLREGEAR